MKKTNYNQLILEQRQTIQYIIDKGHNFTEIGKAIFKDRTTVSKKLREIDMLKAISLMLLIQMVLKLLLINVIH